MITFWHDENGSVYLLAIYAKSAEETLSSTELRTLIRLKEEVEAKWESS